MLSTFKTFLNEARMSDHEHVMSLVAQHKDGISQRLIDDPDESAFRKHGHTQVWSHDQQKQVDIPYEQTKSNVVHNTIGDIRSFDPDHKSRSNTQWMINQYKKGHYKHEDLPRISDQVSQFHKIKGTLPPDQRDLNRYTLHTGNEPKKLSLHKVLNAADATDKLYPDGPHFTHKDAKEVEGTHDRNKLKVFELKSHEAARGFRDSCGHKNNTGGWCTGWKDPENYHNYKEQGKIYGVESLEKQSEGHDAWRKYQFHFPSGSFADKDDTMGDASDHVARNPEMKKVRWDMEHQNDYEYHHEDTPIEHKMPFYHELGQKHQIEQDFENAHEKNIEYHMDNHEDKISQHHITSALQHHIQSDGKIYGPLRHTTIKTMLRLPNATQEHKDMYMSHLIKQHQMVSQKHPSFTGKNIPLEHMSDVVGSSNNPDHLHYYHDHASDNNRGWHTKHIAGIHLIDKFHQMPHVKGNTKADFQKMADDHHSMATDTAKMPNPAAAKKFSEYHTMMHERYKKLADEATE